MNGVWLRAGVVVLILFLCRGAALAIEVPLHQEPFRGGSKDIPFSLTPLQGCKLPEAVGKNPLYGKIVLGGVEHAFMIDRQNETDPYYTRAWIDVNPNNDLMDEKPRTCIPEFGTQVNSSFADLTVEIPVADKKLPYSFSLILVYAAEFTASPMTTANMRDLVWLNIHSRCAYAGDLDLGNKTRHFAILDGDVNGLFAHSAKPPEQFPPAHEPIGPGGDYFLLATGDLDKAEHFVRLGDRLFFGGQLYEIVLDIAGLKAIFTPAKEPLTDVALPADVVSLGLATENYEHGVMCLEPGAKIRVPKGNYRLLQYQLRHAEPPDEMWNLGAAATTATQSVAIGDNPTALAFGAPFSTVVYVPEKSRAAFDQGSGQVALAFVAEGKAGEVIVYLDRLMGNNGKIPMSMAKTQRPAEPIYKIIAPDGETIAKGQFEYG